MPYPGPPGGGCPQFVKPDPDVQATVLGVGAKHDAEIDEAWRAVGQAGSRGTAGSGGVSPAKDLDRQDLSGGQAAGAGAGAAGARYGGNTVPPAAPMLPPAAPTHAPTALPPPTPTVDTGARDVGSTPDFDELSRRFDALKKRG